MQARHVSNAKKSAKGRAIRGGGLALIAIGRPQFWYMVTGIEGFRRAGWAQGMADKNAATPPGARVSDDGKARQAREEARLAAALRANLARRKQQTRARAEGDEEDGPG